MSKDEKERRCKFCGKLLLDEKLPFCRRCFLEGRNKAGRVGIVVGVGAAIVRKMVARINNNSDGGNDTTA
ncbi:MAG: hypothetical protein K1W26_18385 [Acetatifactor sp.]